jgi:thiamine-phosphate pyrophosphorylase
MSDHIPRLYLVTPLIDDVGTFRSALDAALGAGDVASVLLRTAGRRGAQAERLIRALAASTQPRGAALLIEGPPDLALRVGADGAHVSDSGDAVAAAIEKLSPDYIVGVGGLATRDDAMRAGEAGADYVLFGDEAAGGEPQPLERLVERVGWWTEIFVTPCVALAQKLEDVGPLVAAGADFIMLGDCVWRDPRGPATAVADAAKRTDAHREEKITRI